jgi:DNA ligase 1
MRRFAALYDELDSTTATSAKVEALAGYFRAAPPADAAWAVQLLRGERLKRLITGRTLRLWAVEATGLPAWLVDECHAAVGDSAETVALLLDELAPAPAEDLPLAVWIEERLLPLRGLPAEEQRERIVGYWRGLTPRERFVLNKLLTGAFRVGVSRLLVARALARIADTSQDVITPRLMGDWQPSAEAYRALLSGAGDGEDRARP